MKRTIHMTTNNPHINTILPDDILNIIFKMSNNFNTILVCKTWYNHILKQSSICLECNKITKMYDNILWVTDESDVYEYSYEYMYESRLVCHGYYGTLEKYKLVKSMIDANSNYLYKIDRHSIGICLYAIRKHPLLFHSIKIKTRDLIIFAIRMGLNKDLSKKYGINDVSCDGTNLRYITYQTEYICTEAIKQNPMALQYVIKQTEPLCLDAVRKNGMALKYVIKQTESICIEAVKQNGMALKFVKNQTNSICIEAVRNNGMALQYVKKQTEEICLEAVRNKPSALKYVINKTIQICKDAISKNHETLEHIIDQTTEICDYALSISAYALRYIRNPTEEQCMKSFITNSQVFRSLNFLE